LGEYWLLYLSLFALCPSLFLSLFLSSPSPPLSLSYNFYVIYVSSTQDFTFTLGTGLFAAQGLFNCIAVNEKVIRKAFGCASKEKTKRPLPFTVAELSISKSIIIPPISTSSLPLALVATAPPQLL
jgi:hypothetical protein